VTTLPCGLGVVELIEEYLLNPACDLAEIKRSNAIRG